MPTIGMPTVKIEFKSKGLTAIQRSARGIVLLILKETEDKQVKDFTFTNLAQVDEQLFSKDVYKYIKLAFEAAPNRMLIRTYDGKTRTLDGLLKSLTLEKFNYYATPNLTTEDIGKVLSWHKDIVSKKDKTIKYVGFEQEANDISIINWAEPNLIYDGEKYSGLEFTALVASTLAALPLTRSCTFFSWPKISWASLPFADKEDEAVNEGKLFLTYDGKKYKIARGVNSFTEYVQDMGEDFSKIRIVEAIHLIKDDIRDTWNNFYVGKILNKYENKQQFIALINRVYFKELEETVVEAQSDNSVDIDIEANRRYAIIRGADVDEMTEMQIKTYNTGSKLFLNGKVSLLDAMEDLYISFRNE